MRTTPEDGAILAGHVKVGTKNAAAVLRVSSEGRNVDVRRFGNASTNANVAEAVAPVAPGGGFMIVGRTSEILPGTVAPYYIKTYSNLLSGCRKKACGLRRLDRPRDPPHTTFGDRRHQRGLQDPRGVAGGTTPIDRCASRACVGDLNGDGLVDDADFVIFADAYNLLLCPTDPAFQCCPSDFDRNGTVDDADFVLFADAYNALLCP